MSTPAINIPVPPRPIPPAAPATRPDGSLTPRPPMNFNTPGMRLNSRWRKAKNLIITGLAVFSTVLVITPLVAILVYLLYKGASSLNFAFFTRIPAPVGETGGGMANAIVGSGIILLLASLIGIPVGISAGVYLAEFGRGRFLGNAIRFTADVLNGVPSIVMGIAIYSLFLTVGQLGANEQLSHHWYTRWLGFLAFGEKPFSAFAGGLVLAIMMVPTITRTTEEMLSTVPHSIREAALGLGVPKWRTTLSVTLKTALPGIITGCMLAFARVAGETAPLLFTAFGNAFWSVEFPSGAALRAHTAQALMQPVDGLKQPIAALPLQIYVYAVSPYDEWHRLAWAGSLVLIVMIMVSVTLVRVVAGRGVLKGGN